VSLQLESRAARKDSRAVYADILSQAITGELIGMANYAAMVRVFADPQRQCDALRHAATELRHAESFRRAARDIEVEPIVNPEAPYWRRIRAAFLRHADAGDGIACLAVQETMLEPFAVAMYSAVAEVAPESLAQVFRAVAAEEERHIEHALSPLQAALIADRDAVEQQLEELHGEIITILAEMLQEKDSVGHCELCNGDCVKGSLGEVGLNRANLRGRALNQYLRTLDRVGVRGERSLAWVARLPL